VSSPVAETSPRQNLDGIAFEAFGVSVGVTSDDPRVLAGLRGLAPIPSKPCDLASARYCIGATFTEERRLDVRFTVRDGEVLKERDLSAGIAADADSELAIASIDAHVQSCIALNAPEHIFIRAGVVAYNGRAIVLPGGAVSGKSTLVRELVSAGAALYSEDYAPFDEHGLIHPYFRPSIPGQALAETNGYGTSSDPHSAEEMHPLPVSAIVLTTYWPGATWQPQRLSDGEAILALVSHAEAGSERPKETFNGITRAVASHPVVLQSDRGEAKAVAPLLLADVERALAEAA
jgi:hypothetical protein